MADTSELSELWQHWIQMAEESQSAAIKAQESGYVRSASSRYYYAAYQAITALLHYTGQRPPEGAANEETGREGWSHVRTPDMIINNCSQVIGRKDERKRLASYLKELYKIRLSADYHGYEDIEHSLLSQVAKMSKYLVKVVLDILPARKK